MRDALATVLSTPYPFARPDLAAGDGMGCLVRGLPIEHPMLNRQTDVGTMVMR